MFVFVALVHRRARGLAEFGFAVHLGDPAIPRDRRVRRAAAAPGVARGEPPRRVESRSRCTSRPRGDGSFFPTSITGRTRAPSSSSASTAERPAVIADADNALTTGDVPVDWLPGRRLTRLTDELRDLVRRAIPDAMSPRGDPAVRQRPGPAGRARVDEPVDLPPRSPPGVRAPRAGARRAVRGAAARADPAPARRAPPRRPRPVAVDRAAAGGRVAGARRRREAPAPFGPATGRRRPRRGGARAPPGRAGRAGALPLRLLALQGGVPALGRAHRRPPADLRLRAPRGRRRGRGHAASPAVWVWDPSGCRFVEEPIARPEDALVAGARCWASDSPGRARGEDARREPHDGADVGLGRGAGIGCASNLPNLLHAFCHPLRAPDRFLALYRALVRGEEPRISAPRDPRRARAATRAIGRAPRRARSPRATPWRRRSDRPQAS